MNPLIRNIKICWINNEIHPIEQSIIDLLDNTTTKTMNNPTNYWYGRVWYKNDEKLFELYLYNSRLFVEYVIWKRILDYYNLNTEQNQEVMKLLLTKHLDIPIEQVYCLYF